MRKLLLVLLVVAVAFAGCRKDDAEPANDGTVEVSFNATQGLNLKDGSDTQCFDVEGDYAFIVINGEEYYLDVFYLNGFPYTQSIKLLVGGTYEVQEFMLMHDNNTPNTTADDYAIMAAPHANSDFAGFVENALNVEFEISTFDKLELSIEVLCYDEAEHDDFGFVYFQFYEVVVRQECFFGDICVKSLEDYIGSPYEDQGLQYDMAAIMKIEVYRNGDLQDTYINEDNPTGEPLCVWYADRVNDEDEFEFKLYILVDYGQNNWVYTYFHSWYITDDQEFNHGTDGVMDFVLGNCVVEADVVIPPYQDLPSTCNLKIVKTAPGDGNPIRPAYLDLELTGIAPGHDLYDALWPGWCMDPGVTINVNTNYAMDVYSSLYLDKLPLYAQNYNWEIANWLVNHLDYYPGFSWGELQQAMWKIGTNYGGAASAGVPAATALSNQMAADAFLYAPTWNGPFPGDWAAVIFIEAGTPPGATTPNLQTVFTIVDP